MLKSYEATLEHGQVKWLGELSNIESARIIVTLLDETGPRMRRKPPVIHCRQRQNPGRYCQPMIDERQTG